MRVAFPHATRTIIDTAMTDLYEPYERLIPIEVLGKRFEVPENNILLLSLIHI